MNTATFISHNFELSHSGVIVTSAHSGRIYPKDVMKWVNVDIKELRKLEDPFVDILLENASKLDVTTIFALFARCVVDLNRAANELDPKLTNVSGKPYSNTMRVKQGFGVIPRVFEHNRPIYKCLLPWPEVKLRIDRYYTPFHQKLEEAIQLAVQKNTSAIILDFHSMPSITVQKQPQLADIILGDMNGTSCDEAILLELEACFRQHGLTVIRNQPYAGGYITQHYGSPRGNVHVVQIEINRALYMHEFNHTLKSDIAEIQKVLASAVDGIVQRRLEEPALLRAE